MYRVIVGDRNYLSLDYERDFIFRGIHYMSLIDALNHSVCHTKSDLVELVSNRCLQHLDFFKYVLHLPDDIVYKSEKYTERTLGNGESVLDVLNEAYKIFISKVNYLKYQIKHGYIPEPLSIPNAINVVEVIQDVLTEVNDLTVYLPLYEDDYIHNL